MTTVHLESKTMCATNIYHTYFAEVSCVTWSTATVILVGNVIRNTSCIVLTRKAWAWCLKKCLWMYLLLIRGCWSGPHCLSIIADRYYFCSLRWSVRETDPSFSGLHINSTQYSLYFYTKKDAAEVRFLSPDMSARRPLD